jgi:hypothetical protein
MSATLDESPNRHRWVLDDHRVTQLLIDLASFRFQTWTMQASAEVRIGVPFTYREPDGVERRIDPEEPEQLAPLLTLLGRSIDTLVIDRTGELAVDFGEGSRISVRPHPRFQAWEIQGGGALEGLGYICGPGGGSPWG